jgi:hypothetical protein
MSGLNIFNKLNYWIQFLINHMLNCMQNIEHLIGDKDTTKKNGGFRLFNTNHLF